MANETPSWKSFVSPRGGSNAWAQRDDLVDAWRRGAQMEVPPMTMEYAPSLACNADCPLCPYRKSRRAVEGRLPPGTLSPEDGIRSATLPGAFRVLEAAREAGVQGVLFTGGGEPTVWAPLTSALQYSADLGMHNALYTNGFRFGTEDDFAEQVMHPRNGLVFVRFSVNAITAPIVKRHWGLDVVDVRPQLIGLVRTLGARRRFLRRYAPRPLPSVQVSTIVDRNNVEDLQNVCRAVADAFEASGPERGREDVMVVRPLTIHGRAKYSTADHSAAVIRRIVEICGEGSDSRKRLGVVGVRLFLGFGLAKIEQDQAVSYDEILASSYNERSISLAHGVFLTVGPDGSVYPSTEHNCDSKWALGSLATQSLWDIYGGQRRRDVLEFMNANRWGPAVSQPTPRTTRLDAIAGAIFGGTLAAEEIEKIRTLSLGSHSLMLD